MGVRNETYLIYGVKLDYKKVSEKYDEFEEKALFFPWRGKDAISTFGILMDGMCGEYCVAGKCLGIQDDEGEQSFGFMEIPEISAGLDLEVSDWLHTNKLYPFVSFNLGVSASLKDSCLYLISHYH